MGATSGDPVRLAGFETAVAPGRGGAESERTSLSAYNSTVASGCPGRGVSVPALGQFAAAIANMEGNERWLSVIGDELSAADVNDAGVATVDSAVVFDALAASGQSAAPAAVEFSETTRQIVAPTSGMVDDPINAANGNMIHPEHDIVFPAIAAALNITRTWNSLLADRRGAFGDGWSSVLDVGLDVGPVDVVAHLGDGNAIGFVRSADGWVAPSVERLALDAVDDGWVLHTDHIRTFVFDRFGTLTGWTVGVASVSVSRDGGDRIVRLDETVTGRWVEVVWSDGGLVVELVASDGRTVHYQRDDTAPEHTGEGGVSFDGGPATHSSRVTVPATNHAPGARGTDGGGDADGQLRRVWSDAGSVDYVWADGLLVSVVDADGVALFVNDYDDDRRVVCQRSPFGRVSSYAYRDDGMTVLSDADGVVQAMRHDRFGDLTAIVDVDGSAMHLAYDDRHRVIEVVERDGATWRYRYDGDDQVERVDPDGRRLTQVWDDRHRVVEATDRAGTVTRMEHDTDHEAPSRVIQANGGVIHQRLDERGLPVEIVDADGVVNRFEWDRDGQLVATRDAHGAVTEYDYDRHGWLRGIVPATGNPTVMDLAAGGRVVRTVCGEATWTYEYTAAGRVRGGVEPGDVAWSATFGHHGAMASITDAAGSTVGFAYDAIGNVTSTTAPDGDVYRQVYDEVGRLVASVEPTGATTTQAYDRRGRVVEMTDQRGRTWRREVDVMGHTTTSTAPDGTVTRWSYDANGNPITATGPDGRLWRRDFDDEGRPVAIVDPTGERTVIEYTPAGRIRSRTSPAGRSERFEYDAAGRLATVVGIDGRRREARCDDRGRIARMVEFDAAGTPGRSVDYRWDDGYRLLATTEVHDGVERSATVVRDDGGRVVEHLDPTGVRTRYGWNERGLLASATDPAGLATTYDYDVRGRLSGVNAPGGRTHRIAYGADGWAASMTDPAGVVTSMLRDAAGVVTGQRVGDATGWDRTLDLMDHEVSRTSVDQTITASYGYDVAGRLASATASDSDVEIGFLWDDNDLLDATTGPDGTRRIERDADGWVVATVDPDGHRTEFRRDAAGRIVGADGRGAGSDGDGERDLAGRLTIGGDGTVFRYDDAARIAEIAPIDGVPRTFTYGDDGLLVGEDGPSGRREFHTTQPAASSA